MSVWESVDCGPSDIIILLPCERGLGLKEGGGGREVGNVMQSVLNFNGTSPWLYFRLSVIFLCISCFFCVCAKLRFASIGKWPGWRMRRFLVPSVLFFFFLFLFRSWPGNFASVCRSRRRSKKLLCASATEEGEDEKADLIRH